MRFEGAPAGTDMDSFLTALAKALSDTQAANNARAQFVKKVLDRGNYSSADEVVSDLKKFTLRLEMYRVVNRSPTRYGYYRLDAFGRIYNRVLEHIITQEQLNDAMRDMVKDGELTQAELDAIMGQKNANDVAALQDMVKNGRL